MATTTKTSTTTNAAKEPGVGTITSSICMPAACWDYLKAKAKAQNRSVSFVLRELVLADKAKADKRSAKAGGK